MRSQRRFKFKVWLAIWLIGTALLSYGFGYTSGQASVYEKAKNDAKFYHEVWGYKK